MAVCFDFVALSLTPFAWRRLIGSRLRAGESPASLIRSLAPDSPDARETLGRLPGQTRAALDRARAVGAHVIAWGDADYPTQLATIDDPPPVLWVRGDRAAAASPAVSLVGSRAGSPYAIAVATRLAGDLCRHGLAVVSGLARGVDTAAHRGALDVGGATVAVLGSGVDVVYPSEHRDLADAIADTPRCAVLSELPPGTRPRRWFFPLRNRIISGLSRAIVVVEAGEKSGSLITARMALEQGRDVLAVPGSILAGRNRGGHALIRDGAKIVESAVDILEEVGGPVWEARPARAPSPKVSGDPSGDPVLAALPPGEARDFDAISAESGVPAAGLLARLLELELAGAVGRVGGGRFVRLARSC